MILSGPLPHSDAFCFGNSAAEVTWGAALYQGYSALNIKPYPPVICAVIIHYYKHYTSLPSTRTLPLTLSRSGILRWISRPLLTPCKTSRTLVDTPHRVIGGSKIASCTSTPVGQWIIGILPHANPSLGAFHNQGFATHDTPLYLRLPTFYKHHYVRRSLHSVTIRFSRAGMNRKILVRNPTNR